MWRGRLSWGKDCAFLICGSDYLKPSCLEEGSSVWVAKYGGMLARGAACTSSLCLCGLFKNDVAGQDDARARYMLSAGVYNEKRR